MTENQPYITVYFVFFFELKIHLTTPYNGPSAYFERIHEVFTGGELGSKKFVCRVGYAEPMLVLTGDITQDTAMELTASIHKVMNVVWPPPRTCCTLRKILYFQCEKRAV